MCNSVKPIRLKGINGLDIFFNPSNIIKIEPIKNQSYLKVTTIDSNPSFVEADLELKAYLGIL